MYIEYIFFYFLMAVLEYDEKRFGVISYLESCDVGFGTLGAGEGLNSSL